MVCLARASFAQGQDAGLTFAAALGLAPRHPTVVASAEALAEKRAGDAQVARATLNPQLAVQPGFRVAPAADRQPELIAEVLQPFSLSGHGRARRETMAWEEQALAAHAEASVLDQKLGVAEAWMSTWRADRAWDDAKTQSGLATSLAELTRKAAALGAATAADVAEAEVFAAEVDLRRVAAEGEACTRGVELRRLTAVEGAGPLVAQGELPSFEVPSSAALAPALASVSRLPRVRQTRLLARAQRAREVEEAAARGSILALGAAVQRDAPDGLVFSLAARWTPALWDRGERERAQTAAEARLREGDAGALELEARAAMTLAFHEVEHSGEVLNVIAQRLAPRADQAAEGRKKLFASGRATLPEVLMAERRAFAAAADLRQATADHAWARVKLFLLLAALAQPGSAP